MSKASSTPFLSPGQSKAWPLGEVTCVGVNMALVGFAPDGRKVYNAVDAEGHWDVLIDGTGSLTAALPPGHKGAGANVSPQGDLLVTAGGPASNAIPGKGTGCDLYALNVGDPSHPVKLASKWGVTNDVWARIWPVGHVGTDGHFDEYILAECVKPVELGGEFPLGDWLLSRYKPDGTLITRDGQGWRPCFAEPYVYLDDHTVLFATDRDGTTINASTIHSLELHTGLATPLVAGTKGPQEFAGALADGSVLFGWANGSFGYEVWRSAIAGPPVRVTHFNTLMPATRRECTQIVTDRALPKTFWVTVQESDAMHLNTYRVELSG